MTQLKQVMHTLRIPRREARKILTECSISKNLHVLISPRGSLSLHYIGNKRVCILIETPFIETPFGEVAYGDLLPHYTTPPLIFPTFCKDLGYTAKVLYPKKIYNM